MEKYKPALKRAIVGMRKKWNGILKDIDDGVQTRLIAKKCCRPCSFCAEKENLPNVKDGGYCQTRNGPVNVTYTGQCPVKKDCFKMQDIMPLSYWIVGLMPSFFPDRIDIQ